ncbi:MAG: DUF4097 family beta strand repeat protein [Bryobacterales bacterium]|nr:DUF4097 family beta strand repeat protein [Bryobacterales bacterium]
MKFVTAIAIAGVLAAGARADVEDRETIRQTLPTAPKLEVKNIQGYVHVTGGTGSQIQLVAEKLFRAKDSGELSLLKQEVRLDWGVSGDTVKVCVQGPWTTDCKDPDRHRPRERNNDRHYSFTYNIELQIPANMEVRISTINKGDVLVRNVNGKFEARNVNGPVVVEDMKGSGSAQTVNGPVTAKFSRTPAEAVSLKTVNGRVAAEFPKDTSASLRFKTLHGDVFTDFPTEAVTPVAASGEKRGAKYVYQSKRSFAVRIGNGGPEHSFETINGDIEIRQRGQ